MWLITDIRKQCALIECFQSLKYLLKSQGILDNRLLQENILGQRDSADKNVFKTPSPKIQNILSRFLYYLTSIQKATQQKYFSHKL